MNRPDDSVEGGRAAASPVETGQRPSRRGVLIGGASLAAAAGAAVSSAAAQDAQSGHADFLFVQTAQTMTYDADQKRLTLGGTSPTTLFFSDRPERIAGTMHTERFPAFWSEGSNSFLSDPPNADLSILDGGELRQVVVVLRDPELSGGDLSYTVSLIEGEMPAEGASVSLFIDIIGMPLTPLSFAGARRRAWRRAVFY
jgi:hypothetical protein